MPLTSLEVLAAQAIVTMFETGNLAGPDRYSACTFIPGDTGGLSYGKHQVTLNSGNLYFLLQRFCQQAYDSNSTAYTVAHAIEPYLPKVKYCASVLNDDNTFIELLQSAGALPEMRKCQNDYFNDAFWVPSQLVMRTYGFALPLSASVLYDSFVQGAWEICKDLTIKRHGLPNVSTEKQWIANYVNTRRIWLANNVNRVLRSTVYRQDTYLALIKEDNWQLTTPFTAHVVCITQESLLFDDTDPSNDGKPVVHGNASDNYPILSVGCDAPAYVEAVKKALRSFGYPMPVDGNYTQTTAIAVTAFQRAHNLIGDGKVGSITYNALGIVL